MEFIAQYKAARRVSTPLVAVRTFDAQSTLGIIRAALGERIKDNALILWDVCHGMQALTDKGGDVLPQLLNGAEVAESLELGNCLRFAERAEHSANLTLFISNAHLYWKDDPTVIQGIWNLRDGFKANGNMLILMCSPGATLPPELTSDVLVIDEPLPTAEQIRGTVSGLFEFAKLPAPDADILTRATDALLGLPAFPVEQTAAMCLDTKARTLDIPQLWERKKQVIAQTPGLSVMGSTETLDSIGGLKPVKEFFTALMNGNEPPKAIIFTDEVEKAFAGTGSDMSGVKTELTGSMLQWTQDRDIDGALLLGIPGVGKSFLIKCLGAEFGVPVVNFQIDAMQGGIVGSSGANLRAAQKTIDAISSGRILWVATCNSVNALPPELLGRFKTAQFFFDVPTQVERASIWGLYRTKYGIKATDTTPQDEGWTGREIKECASKAYRMRLSLKDAARYVVPVTKSNAERIQALRAASSGKYLSASKPGLYTAAESITAPASTVTANPSGRVVRFDEE